MSDEPPDYINWGDGRSGTSFFGCIASAIGALFLLTGGLCVFVSGGGETERLTIGLALIAIGVLLMRVR